MDIVFGSTLGLAAVNAESEILNFSAIWPIVSPALTVYVKGVGEGKGVIAETTNPIGCEAVAVDVNVRYGLMVMGTALALDTCVVQAAANKMHKLANFRMT